MWTLRHCSLDKTHKQNFSLQQEDLHVFFVFIMTNLVGFFDLFSKSKRKKFYLERNFLVFRWFRYLILNSCGAIVILYLLANNVIFIEMLLEALENLTPFSLSLSMQSNNHIQIQAHVFLQPGLHISRNQHKFFIIFCT